MRVMGPLIVAAWVLCAWGCDRPARHKALNFFFTGVPPLEDPKKKEAVEAPPPSTVKKEAEKKVPAPKTRTFFSHTPYALGACSECHPASSFGANIVKSRPGQGGMLTLSPDELCIRCHVYKSEKTASKTGLRLHSPVEQGHCSVCHSPHRSKNRYMLLDNRDALCLRCHSQEDIKKGKAHKGPKWSECTSCHNPHIGTRMRLLNKDLY